MIRPTYILKADAIETDRGTVWQDRAACVDEDPEMFHPTPGDAEAIATAKSVCARCPVTQECLSEALEGRLQGVWGGLTDDERFNLLRRQKRAARKRHYVNGKRG